jgi:anti-sigma regulatory factor (Ser/Thr protein kinase)
MMRAIDLSNMSAADAEARIVAVIEAEQKASLEEYEIVLIDFGADRDDIDAELERYRDDLRNWRDAAIARLRNWLRHGAAVH